MQSIGLVAGYCSLLGEQFLFSDLFLSPFARLVPHDAIHVICPTGRDMDLLQKFSSPPCSALGSGCAIRSAASLWLGQEILAKVYSTSGSLRRTDLVFIPEYDIDILPVAFIS